ncbi:phospholipase A2 [Streptomyces sp. NPDC006259]|uniref:phospholipase A2 n=1 Tax=Streptomyces sp. NPDC006259 TaxID=3364740 RepID=UPI00368FFAB4
MSKLRTALPGIAISGVLLATAATPAMADSAAPAGDSSPSVAAAVTKAQKLSKMKSLTGDSNASSLRWTEALAQHRGHKQAIEKYRFDWSTNYCNSSPDRLPGGYDFRWGCYRHDFGYRNYKALVGKPAFKRDHKLRIDKALLRDLNTACGYRPWADPYTPTQRKNLKKACLKTAKKYYQAVRAAG